MNCHPRRKKRALCCFLLFLGIISLIIYIYADADFIYDIKAWYYEDPDDNIDIGSYFGNPVCRIPELEPFHKSVKPYFSEEWTDDKKCKLKRLTYIKDSTLFINIKNVQEARLCQIERIDDFKIKIRRPCQNLLGEGYEPNTMLQKFLRYVFRISLKSKDVNMKIKLNFEFAKLELRVNNTGFEEFHANVLPPSTTPVPREENQLDIIMIMYDSTSNANLQRHMKKTYKRLSEDSNTFIMKGHTIVGDGTTAQLCAFLTGIPEDILPESRRGFANAKPVDVYPFIFKDLHRRGYITMYSEDMPKFGTFQFRLKGWDEIPTKFYLRPFWHAVAPQYKHDSDSCPHELAFEYIKRYLHQYKDFKKYGFLNFADLTHDDLNKLSMADDDTFDFYQFLEKHGYLNNAAVFLFGDHGIRGAGFRGTMQGKLEERLPFLSITLPEWFVKKFPIHIEHLRKNTEVLTSHFDFYSTLKHLITFPNNDEDNSIYGRSLLTNIHEFNRTCEDIRVRSHWCPCILFNPLDKNDPVVVDVSKKAVEFLNKLIEREEIPRKKCAKLYLKKVVRAGKRSINSKLQQFEDTKKNKVCDSCVVEYEKRKALVYLYEVTFTVKPSGGQFEMTADVSFDRNNNYGIHVNPGISRTDPYGDQPACTRDDFPHLRQMCYCR